MEPDRLPARALAEQRHVARIASEAPDILPHPVERQDLILET